MEFQPAYAMLTLSLAAGEAVRVEPGAMVAQENVTMETKSSGGFFKGLKKMAFGGESFFLNTFTGGAGGGWISLAPSAPGDLAWFDVQPGRQLFIQSGSFMASASNVQTDTQFQGLKGAFSGESLFFIRAFTEDSLPGRATSIWRYRELMPVLDDANVVTLGEGWTPILPAPPAVSVSRLVPVKVPDG
mgnify:CR=1 FL=1